MQNSSNANISDLKCIWMLAGIINYKLCNRNFQCERCDFDKVMHGLLPNNNIDTRYNKNSIDIEYDDDLSISQQINQYLYTIFSSCKIYLDRFYHQSHFWYKLESDNVVRVGINNLIIKILEPIQNIILPKIGEFYYQDQLTARIIRQEKTLPLCSPIKGKIVEINDRILLNDFQQASAEDDYSFKMEAKEVEGKLHQLCGNISGLKYFAASVNLVRKYLKMTFNQPPPSGLGITIADGGRTEMCLEKVIGAKNFQNLLDDFFLESN
jgi:glycine cleavage system H lipoate-binding protein